MVLPEKNYKLTTKYYIGDSLSHKWSSVYNYRPQSQEVFETKGEIFAVMNLFASDGFNAVTAGNLLIDYFHEVYFESKKDTVIDSVVAAIHAVQDRLTELLAHEEAAAKDGVDLNIAIMVIRGEELYFVTFGNAKIMLLPSGMSSELVDVSAALRDPYGKAALKIGSSYALKDQRLAIATETAVTELGEEELTASLTSLNDLRIKNTDYHKPEEVALFLVGIEVEKRGGEVAPQSPISQISIQESLSEDPGEYAARLREEDLAMASVDEEVMLDTSLEAENKLATDQEEELARFEQEPVPHYQEAEFEGRVEIPEDLQPQPSFGEKLQGLLSQVPVFLKEKLEDIKKMREVSRLQQMRQRAAMSSAVGYNEDQPLTTRGLLRNQTEEVTADTSTLQALRIKTVGSLMRSKDIFLYDVLKVNQRKSFQLSKTNDGKIQLTLLGVSLSQNALIAVAAGLLVLLAISQISSYGESNARRNKILAASDKLSLLEGEITQLEASPVLNDLTFAAIPESQALLQKVKDTQTKFGSDLDVLPEDKVAAAKDRLTSMESRILRKKTSSATVLLDTANSYEGTVQDMVRVGENIYVLDKVRGRVYRQPTSGGNGEIVVENLNGPESIAADANGQLIIYNPGDGTTLTVVNPVNKESYNVKGISTDKLPVASKMAVYDTSNALYSVSKTTNKVFQLNRVGKDYSLPSTRYVQDGANAVNDIKVINKQLFILAQGVGIVRIGNNSATVSAFPEILESLKTAPLFSHDTTHLYVVDAKAKRLLVFTINRGNQSISDFVAQVPLDQIKGEVTSIAVDQQKGLVIIADSSKIYSFNRAQMVQ